jgi:fructose-1-phosphate kinase PfkB-like protein
MGGDVIITVTLNAALHVAYTAGDLAAEGINPVSRPGYRAGGRGVTVARVLRAFGHDVLAAGLAGGSSGELIRDDLARSGVPTAFTLIRGESRRFFRFAGAVTATGGWTARVAAPDTEATYLPARGALVAGLVPGQLLGWSWPDRLRHALALAAGGGVLGQGAQRARRPGSRGPGRLRAAAGRGDGHQTRTLTR